MMVVVVLLVLVPMCMLFLKVAMLEECPVLHSKNVPGHEVSETKMCLSKEDFFL
jgi:hypothetical protein